ncbi:MAG: chitobiase/beta-hexosaminidase C-terminal domain-containing protein [Clostridia bacterium]|nr:chitobiase/beta-hexosaminidase C-terminal domain-containing protein [Clostridia bacterium]
MYCTIAEPTENHPDPSGYVYEAVPSNRVEGVKAEVYYYDYPLDEFGVPKEEKEDILWNAEEYGQINPQYTDENGMFGWDVPLGEWLVKFSKEGYYDTDSRGDVAANENGYLPVPPPQLAVNTAIVSKAAPTVKDVNVYADEIQIIFSQYMQIDTVNGETVKVTCGGKRVGGTVTPKNAEYNYEGTVQYASVFVFTPNEALDGKATVTIGGAVNYADKAMESAYTETKDVLFRPESISVSETVTVEYGSGAIVEIEVLPAKAGKNLTLTVTSVSPSVVEVVTSSVTTDENGKATVMLNGLLPGETQITVSLDGTDVSASFRAAVNDLVVNQNSCEKVTANLETGSKVEKGTMLVLETATEGAEIYYTLDGTCPCIVDSPARIKYTGPIAITEDMFIIAYAVKDGMEDSKTAGFVFTVEDPAECNHTFGAWTAYSTTHSRKCACGKTEMGVHEYGDWMVTSPATVNSEGLAFRICKVCYFQNNKVLPKLENTQATETKASDTETTADSQTTDENNAEDPIKIDSKVILMIVAAAVVIIGILGGVVFASRKKKSKR